MKKVDQIVGKLIEGWTYLVPTIVGSLNGTDEMRRHPVIGVRHYDVEFFNVHMPHYHLDLRFVDDNEWHYKMRKSILVGVGRRNDGSVPLPTYEKMRCLNAHVIIHVSDNPGMPGGVMRMHERFKGAQCAGSKKLGWVCPHKLTFLGGQPPYNGIITCPAHGLKIDSETGRVL